MGDEFFGTVWPQYLALLPMVLVLVAGAVVALVQSGRHPRAAWLTFAAAVLLLLVVFANPAVVNWLIRRERNGLIATHTLATWLFVVSILATLMHAASWGLLLVAVFIGRGARADAAPAFAGAVAYAGSAPAVRPMSKPLFLVPLGLMMLVGWLTEVLGFVLLAQDEDDLIPAALGSFAIAWLATLVVAVLVGVIVYRMWAALRFGTPRTTPGMALGLLFVPLFNLYWIFQVWYGWTVDYNRSVAQAGIPAPRVSQGLAMTLCVLLLLSILPPIGLIAQILLLIHLSGVLGGVNAIAAAPRAPAHLSAA